MQTSAILHVFRTAVMNNIDHYQSTKIVVPVEISLWPSMAQRIQWPTKTWMRKKHNPLWLSIHCACAVPPNQLKRRQNHIFRGFPPFIGSASITSVLEMIVRTFHEKILHQNPMNNITVMAADKNTWSLSDQSETSVFAVAATVAFSADLTSFLHAPRFLFFFIFIKFHLLVLQWLSCIYFARSCW